MGQVHPCGGIASVEDYRDLKPSRSHFVWQKTYGRLLVGRRRKQMSVANGGPRSSDVP